MTRIDDHSNDSTGAVAVESAAGVALWDCWEGSITAYWRRVSSWERKTSDWMLAVIGAFADDRTAAPRRRRCAGSAVGRGLQRGRQARAIAISSALSQEAPTRTDTQPGVAWARAAQMVPDRCGGRPVMDGGRYAWLSARAQPARSFRPIRPACRWDALELRWRAIGCLYVVPILGGIAVWLTMARRRSTADHRRDRRGILAFSTLLSSYDRAMSDSAGDDLGAAAWGCRLEQAVGDGRAGIACGGRLTRPNPCRLATSLPRRSARVSRRLAEEQVSEAGTRSRLGRMALFAAGAFWMPHVGASNEHLYGSPMESG